MILVGRATLVLMILFGVFGHKSSARAAQEYPSAGVLFGAEARDYIHYECDRNQPDLIDCEFNQVTARTKAGPDDLKKRLARIPETLAGMKDPKERKSCGEIGQMIEAMETGKPPKFANAELFNKNISGKPRGEREDIKKTLKALQKVCANPTEENVRALLMDEYDRDSRTCKLMGNHYRQSFKATVGGIWVHTSEPTGPCGTIFISEFTPEKSFGMMMWNHRTRKVITNKNATNVIMKCSDFDEQPYSYVWRKEPVYRKCDYIDYGF